MKLALGCGDFGESLVTRCGDVFSGARAALGSVFTTSSSSSAVMNLCPSINRNLGYLEVGAYGDQTSLFSEPDLSD
jgi:hypothetical protein